MTKYLSRGVVVDGAPGIIRYDPIALRCGSCGCVWSATTQTERANPNAAVLLSGSRFHTCDGNPQEGVRLCPSCLRDSLASCTAGRDHGGSITDGERLGELMERWKTDRDDGGQGLACLVCGGSDVCASCREANTATDPSVEVDEYGTPPLLGLEWEQEGVGRDGRVGRR